MDEPTSALDIYRQVQVLDFMRTLARKREVIVFIALHDLNQALRFADQVQAPIERCSRGQPHILIDGIV